MAKCNCENLRCKSHSGDVCGEEIPAGKEQRCLYIGSICQKCAENMDKRFLVPSSGQVDFECTTCGVTFFSASPEVLQEHKLCKHVVLGIQDGLPL